jgi:hypothetical protein
MARKAKQPTQKQKQRQSVKQTVIVKVGETPKRKRTYRKRVSRGGQPKGEEQYIRPLPASNVIYQSTQYLPQILEQTPTPKITEPEKKPKTLLEDVGVGTEGFVKILELPSKRETIERLTTPVEAEMEKKERKQMEREDVASIELGLSKFNTEPKPRITQKIAEPQIKLEGAPIGMPQMDREQEAISAQSEKMAQFKPSSDSVLTSMYERYGPKIESEAKKREDARQERNRKRRESYARKKAAMQSKE